MSEMRTATDIIARANAEAARIDAAHAKWFAEVSRTMWRLLDTPHWSTPLPRAPGIYWTRTGGKTHTVEVVRDGECWWWRM